MDNSSLKFRAWYSGEAWDKEMMYCDTIHELADYLPTNWKDLGTYHVLQYTGLKDKNGNEIYEGDVVKYIDITSDKYMVYGSPTKGIVEFYPDKCCLAPREIEINHKGGRYLTPWDFTNEVEVIGNIYESPELLEDSCP